jgi:signal transduction histidine kinase
MEECDVHEIVERALKSYEDMCIEQSIVTERSFCDVSPIEGDKEQVLEAIENLISNAIDAMPDGGTLTVVTDTEVLRGSQYALVKIKDTGKGIPEEDLSKIFEPFFTTKLLLKGTGLGLSIAKKIVEDHGGFITIDSMIGTGSTFSLYFPYKPKLPLCHPDSISTERKPTIRFGSPDQTLKPSDQSQIKSKVRSSIV